MRDPEAWTSVESLYFSVPTDPVAKARPRASFNGGKPRMYTPSKTQEAEWRIRTAFVEAFPQHQPWDAPVSLTVTAFLRMPGSLPKKRHADAMPTSRPDCDNYLKTALDALNGVAFTDDSRVVAVMCTKAYARAGTPGWEIELHRVARIKTVVPPHIPAQEALLDEESAATPRRLVGAAEV